MKILASRYHDICIGHRVVGQGGACVKLHGHNLRIHFHCSAAELNPIGMVIDYGDIKKHLCMWLEDTWDHNFLMWDEDPFLSAMPDDLGVIVVPFNPTSENIAQYLLEVVGPLRLSKGIELCSVVVEETRKCSAEVSL